MSLPDSSRKAPNVFFDIQDDTGSAAPVATVPKIGPRVINPPPPPPPPAALDEWWGDVPETDVYNFYNGVLPYPPDPINIYRRTVTRVDGNGIVLTDSANSDTGMPTTNWMPFIDDSAPVLSSDSPGIGSWLINIDGLTTGSGQGGVFQIIGPGTEILEITFVWGSSAHWVISWIQNGSPS